MHATMNDVLRVSLNTSTCRSALSCRVTIQRVSKLILNLAIAAAFVATPASNAQNPMAPSTAPAKRRPRRRLQHSRRPQRRRCQSREYRRRSLQTPPLPPSPLRRSPSFRSTIPFPGAALSVAGPLQAWNGRAYITGSGTITAGDQTAQVTLPYRGTMHVCASSSVKLAADSSAASGDVPGLLVALDRGAVEMSFAASKAREQNADTLLTPYFRIMIGGPNAADVSVRMGDDGDTCVDNAGTNAPYVVVTSVFEGGLYRVQPGQRVMFEHGSLQKVVDEEKEPCGCPPPTKSEANEFPLAASEGLAPKSPPATAANTTAGSGQAATTLVYKSSQSAPQSVTIPQPPASPGATAPATPAANAPGAQKKPGFFRKIGRFFKRIFGAE